MLGARLGIAPRMEAHTEGVVGRQETLSVGAREPFRTAGRDLRIRRLGVRVSPGAPPTALLSTERSFARSVQGPSDSG